MSSISPQRQYVRARWGDKEMITAKLQKCKLEWLGYLTRMPSNTRGESKKLELLQCLWEAIQKRGR
jgi:hypothetical protein